MRWTYAFVFVCTANEIIMDTGNDDDVDDYMVILRTAIGVRFMISLVADADTAAASAAVSITPLMLISGVGFSKLISTSASSRRNRTGATDSVLPSIFILTLKMDYIEICLLETSKSLFQIIEDLIEEQNPVPLLLITLSNVPLLN